MTSLAAGSEDFQQVMTRAFESLKKARGSEGVALALEHAETARRLNPDSAEPLFVLGMAAFALKDIGGAIRLLEEAHKLDPDGKEIVEFLAALHGRAGNISESLYYTKLALTLDENPRLAQFMFDDLRDFEKNVAQAESSSYGIEAHYAFLLRKYDETVEACRRELELHRENAEAYRMMGRALLELGKYEDAVAALETAARLTPRDATGFVYLAEGLRRQGRLSLALDCCREAVRLDPASMPARSQLLTTLAYLPADHWRTYPDEAKAAIAAIAPGSRPAPPPLVLAPKTVDENRHGKIRVGYLINETTMTRDLGFLEAIFAHHDHSRFFVHGYQQYSRPFSDTTRLQKNADDWRQVFNIDDETLFFIVANDAIDVLVDLCGAASDSRPAFLARRPAPIQVSWLGFPQGALPGTVDWLVSDAELADVDERDSAGTPVLRLGDRLFAYNGVSVDVAAAAEGSSPAATNGFVTFGGALDPARIAASAPLWEEVLRRTPGARLLLGPESLPDEGTRERIRVLFAGEGIADRIIFQESAAETSRLAGFYASVDIVLDTLPVNGSVELCNALALGVPVVSCRGDRRTGMAGASILAMAGCEKWAAKDRDEFAAIAAKLASDVPALAELRKALPGKIKKSPLCDGKKFTAVWEATLDILVKQARAAAASRAEE